MSVTELMTNTATQISSRWRDATNPQTILTSMSLTQNDILIQRDGASTVATTTATSPVVTSNGNGVLSIPLAAADLNFVGYATVFVRPPAAIEQSFRLNVVAKLSWSHLTNIEADTNELQADWAEGGRLNQMLDARMPTTHIAATAGKVDGVATVDVCASNSDMRGSDGALLAANYVAPDNERIEELTTRLTSARAGYLDKLNVAGTLANSDDAERYQADVTALELITEILSELVEDDEGLRFTAKALEQAPSGSIIGGGDASQAKQDEILSKLGGWSGTAENHLLGAFRALFNKTATLPSDLGETMNPETDSVEAIGELVKLITETMGTGMVTVVSHQVPGETIVLVKGDSYRQTQNRELKWVNSSGSGWPIDLTNAVIRFTAVKMTESGKALPEIAVGRKIEGIGEVRVGIAPDQEVVCELHSWQTDCEEGVYYYDVEATLPGGEIHTLVTTADQVVGSLTSAKKEQFGKKLLILPSYS